MVRFSVIGLNHNHIYGQVSLLLRAGAEVVSVYAPEPELIAEFMQAFPQAHLAGGAQEILEDESIQLVVSAGIPNERAPLGIQVMRHGKDFMSDAHKQAFIKSVYSLIIKYYKYKIEEIENDY